MGINFKKIFRVSEAQKGNPGIDGPLLHGRNPGCYDLPHLPFSNPMANFVYLEFKEAAKIALEANGDGQLYFLNITKAIYAAGAYEEDVNNVPEETTTQPC
jgi:hypothetical protein